MKKCATCRYGREYELDKPCVVYRADCPLYEKEGDGMTNKEAIRLLENERDNHINGNGVIYETRTEAIDMAIKELKQDASGDLISREAVLDELNKWDWQELYLPIHFKENIIDAVPSVNPQEPCDDAISRQAVLDAIEHEDKWLLAAKGHNGLTEIAFSGLKARVDALPSVNPQEPKTGHCKDCKYFEYDSVAKVDEIPLIVAHEICSRWGDGCKTKEDGYCFLFEPKESDHKCHNCKHYMSGEYDGSCDSYICEHYSDWESEDKE